MPRKINKRKAIQAAKRKAAAAIEARKSRRWPGTRREGAVHQHSRMMALAALLLGGESWRARSSDDPPSDQMTGGCDA